MSLRAIKKRETLATNSVSGARPTLYRKSTAQQQHRRLTGSDVRSGSTASASRLQQQRTRLGRLIHSNPELRSTAASEELAHARLVRTKSESDVNRFPYCSMGDEGLEHTSHRGGMTNARSEVCLESISSHTYQQSPSRLMHSAASSQRDLRSQSSTYSGSCETVSSSRRRMSDNSMDANSVVRVPIIGYEVMEERARFTVYKLRVDNPLTNDCWLVLRRYTDFVRLNTKLKQLFPRMTLMLPRKKIFGDNFNSVFLDNRVQGLQMFVNSVMSKAELRQCKIVREFFCLDEPPSYSESMEECRAIFEAQEETIAHLKLQISNKNDLILNLQQKLREENVEKERLKDQLNQLSSKYQRSSTPNGALPKI